MGVRVGGLEAGFGWRLRAMGRPSGRQHVPLPTTKMGRVPAWIASAVMKLGVKVPLPTSAKDARRARERGAGGRAPAGRRRAARLRACHTSTVCHTAHRAQIDYTL